MDITFLYFFLSIATIFSVVGILDKGVGLLYAGGLLFMILGIAILAGPITDIVCVSTNTTAILADNCITLTESDYSYTHNGLGLITLFTGLSLLYTGFGYRYD